MGSVKSGKGRGTLLPVPSCQPVCAPHIRTNFSMKRDLQAACLMWRGCPWTRAQRPKSRGTFVHGWNNTQCIIFCSFIYQHTTRPSYTLQHLRESFSPYSDYLLLSIPLEPDKKTIIGVPLRFDRIQIPGSWGGSD